ncbi:MAG: hypothetical protein ACFFCD_16415 [Promethearchaeota archaeon]
MEGIRLRSGVLSQCPVADRSANICQNIQFTEKRKETGAIMPTRPTLEVGHKFEA